MSYAPDPRATGRQSSGLQAAGSRSALDARVVRFLERLCATSFFGKVVVSFQNGKVIELRTEQTTKVEEL